MKIKTSGKLKSGSTTVRTGEHCPASSVWKVEGSPSTTAPIAKGNVMPPYGGKQ